MRTLLSFVTTAFLLLPSFCSAQSFTNLQDKLLFQPESNLYRLRQTTKPWQLVGLPAGYLPERSELFAEHIFLVASRGGRKAVLASGDGMRFVPVADLSGDQLSLKRVGRFLVAATTNGSAVSYYLTDNSLQWRSISSPTLLATELINRLIDVGGELTLVTQSSQVDVVVYRQSSWVTVAELPCGSSELINQPIALINCGDRLYYRSTGDAWLPLLPQPFRTMAAGINLIAQSAAEPTTFYVFDGVTVSTLVLTDFGTASSAGLATFGSRYFLRGDQLWEIVLGPIPTLQAADPNPLAGIIATVGADRLYLRSTTRDAASDQVGSWQSIAVATDYTNAEKTEGGWLLWKHNGSSTQFAASNSSAYQIITTSWAASSKIQEITKSNGTTFLWLFNSTNKPNLYKTVDFSQWTRITLPTNPTLPVTIAEARALPAGTLVNITGTISVLTGTVAADVIYLQDETGGMQVFLSIAKGLLPTALHRAAEATGQISASQAKRVALDAVDDLTLGKAADLNLPLLTPTEAIAKLGWVMMIGARVSAVNDDYLSLESLSSILRHRYHNLSLDYQPLDEGIFPAVVDYNSSSGQVESWSLGDDRLTKRPEEPAEPLPPPAESPPPDPASPTETVTTSSVAAAPSAPAKAKTVSPNQPKPKATLTSSSKVEPGLTVVANLAAGETLVLPARDLTSPNTVPLSEALILSLLSLIAGMLSLRGRRFRHLLER